MRFLLATLFLALFPADSALAVCLTGDCNRSGSGFAQCALAVDKVPTSDACTVGHAAYFAAYVDGVLDSLIDRKIACPPPSATRNRGRRLVKQYLHEHPERWNQHIYDLTRDALVSAYPCEKA